MVIFKTKIKEWGGNFAVRIPKNLIKYEENPPELGDIVQISMEIVRKNALAEQRIKEKHDKIIYIYRFGSKNLMKKGPVFAVFGQVLGKKRAKTFIFEAQRGDGGVLCKPVLILEKGLPVAKESVF